MSNVLIVVCFTILIIVSICGNSLVCRTLFCRRKLSYNSTNLLIGMLAISDLLMTMFNIPFTVADIILNDWIFGDFFCILVSFVQANSVYVSSFTMAVIAIDRCQVTYRFKSKRNHHRNHDNNNFNNKNFNDIGDQQQQDEQNQPQRSDNSDECLGCCCCCGNQCFVMPLIKCPLFVKNCLTRKKSTKTRPRFKLQQRTKIVLIILAIWIMAALHSLPHSVFNRVTKVEIDVKHQPTLQVDRQHQSDITINKTTIRRCVPLMPDWLNGPRFSLWLTLYTTASQYVIPLSIAAIIYTRIGFTIVAQGKVGHMTEMKQERINKQKRKRLLMLALIVAIFAICWLPFNVYYLLLDFGITKSFNHTAFLFCLWLATSSVCYNPFVYCWLNKNFRQEAKNVWKRIKQFIPSMFR